jgi:alpha-ketoglutarate-dependent taurine dioxygenase
MLATAVTGWKSVFVNRGFTRRINGVTKDESDILLAYLFNVCSSIFANEKNISRKLMTR